MTQPGCAVTGNVSRGELSGSIDSECRDSRHVTIDLVNKRRKASREKAGCFSKERARIQISVRRRSACEPASQPSGSTRSPAADLFYLRSLMLVVVSLRVSARFYVCSPVSES